MNNTNNMNTIVFLKEIIKNKKLLYMSLCGAFILGRVGDHLLPLIFKFLVDFSSEYISFKSDDLLFKIISLSVLLIFTALVSRFSFRVFDYYEAKFIPTINAEIPTKIFKYITNHSTSYFDNNFSGEIVHKIKQISDISKNLLITFPVNIIAALIALIISCVIIFPKSLILGFSILLFGIFYVIASYYLANKNKELASIWSGKNSKFNGHLIDSVENMILVKSFNKKDYELNKVSEYAIEEKNSLYNLKINVAKIKIIHTLISSFIIIFVTFYSLYLYLNGLITLGDFVFNYTIIAKLTNEFYAIGELTSEMLEKHGTFSAALGFIYKKQDKENDLPNIEIVNPSISFNNVFFKYKEKFIFENLNLQIKANEKVALVGHSGSGKSTIVKMILKQYPIKSGNINIDNQNIENYNVDSINNSITYINQNIYLFNRTIRENIAYVKPEATEEEILESCRKSGAIQFIENKENGLDTVIGERGVQLSGGEKQRLAMARAFLLNNPILILDEPTSALDSISEDIIQESLKELMKNKTVIIIAHRLSTIKNMDRLIVLEQGKIIEEGTHSELLKKDGLYKKMWNKQSFN